MPASPAPITPPAPRQEPRPRLEAVRRPSRRPALRADDVRVYALGLLIGFLLASLASTPGGALLSALPLVGAAVSAVVVGLATLRIRRTRGGRLRAVEAPPSS